LAENQTPISICRLQTGLGDAPGWIVVFEDALHAAHTAKQAGIFWLWAFGCHE
jgi:beta-phosphoglucomutase-like phosphatase (HAD superfamily)